MFLKPFEGRLLGLAPDKPGVLALQRVEEFSNRREIFNETSIEPAIPRNPRTILRFLGIGKIRMTSTLTGKTFTP
jgi:hypothetical protein